jgi:RNA-directed DNA polymerase
MESRLERIAERARCEPKLRFTSLAHHITEDRVWKSLCQIPSHSAPGVDGQGVSEAKESFEGWIGVMLQSIHRKGYRAPDIRRVYIPKHSLCRQTAAQPGSIGRVRRCLVNPVQTFSAEEIR